VDGKIGEVFRRASGRASGALGSEDQLPGVQDVLPTVDFEVPRTRYAHEDDVHLVVDVLPDAPSGPKRTRLAFRSELA
jgi:hypothetical protein